LLLPSSEASEEVSEKLAIAIYINGDRTDIFPTQTIDRVLPESVLHYVLRSRASVVLDRATHDGDFTQDPYIQSVQPMSILCYPLLNQGNLIGLVYMENQVTIAAFTNSHIEFLQLLSGQAAIAITNAKNPILLVGNGAIRSQASQALTTFAQGLRIPVANTFMGKGVMDYRDPLALWSVGLQSRDFITCGFEHADLVICVGYDLIEYSPKKWNPTGQIPIVHIDQTPAEIDSSYIPIVEVVGDISSSLGAILEILQDSASPHPEPYGLGLRSEIQADYEHYAQDTEFPLKPQKIIYDLRQVMAADDIVISDVGAHKMWMARHYHCEKPNTCIISNGFAAMGIAVPGAIAAKLTQPDRKVVAVTGDGGFMMNFQELETALRIGTPFVTLIFNDGAYGLIKWKQQNQFGESNFVQFGNPDFVKLAESMGLKGYRITSAEMLIPTLKDALAQSIPAIVDCPVDYRENLKFTQQGRELTCQI